MRTDPDLWPLPSPRADGEDLPWLMQEQRIVGLRWKGDVLRPDNPLFHLGGFPVSQDGGVFPLQFRYDPATGTPLREATADGPLASHPGFARDGFPTLLNDLSFRHQPEHARVAVPAGVVAIFTAGAPARLFALTDRGGLFFRVTPQRWSELPPLAPVTFPLHAFGVCAHEQGFATVLCNQAVIVRITQGLPEVEVVAPRSVAGATFCGAPALMPGGILAFPLSSGSSVRVARYELAGARWLEELPATGALSDGGEILDPPVQTQSSMPDVFWIGSRETIRLTCAYGAWQAQVDPLPAGLSFVRGAPVLRDERDTLHGLVQSADHYALLALSGTKAQTPLDGPALSAGRARYFARYFYPSLVQAESVTLQVEAGGENVLLPLAYGVNARGDTEGTLLALVQGVAEIGDLLHGQKVRSFSGTLYWHAGAQLYPFGITLKIRSRREILIYKDASFLHVGSALTGDFYQIGLK